MLEWHSVVGYLGTTMILVAYLLLQIERLASDGLTYSMLNGLGAVCLIVSLMYAFNLPALIIEIFWAVISLIGVVRWVIRVWQTA